MSEFSSTYFANLSWCSYVLATMPELALTHQLCSLFKVYLFSEGSFATALCQLFENTSHFTNYINVTCSSSTDSMGPATTRLVDYKDYRFL
jgi:hypothetical protein